MTASFALEWYRQMLWAAMLTAGPLVLSVVIVGFLIAILQAATQVNDAAVAFAPKAIVAVITLVLSGPFMLRQMSTFMVAALDAMGKIGP